MKPFLRKFFLGLVIAQALFLTPLSVSFEVDIPQIKNGDGFAILDTLNQTSISANIIPQSAHAQLLEDCNTGWTGLGDVGCQFQNALLSFYYYLFYATTQTLAVIAAFIFDTVLNFSISSNFYRQIGVVEVGWEILRDLSNIIFLFALLYIAFRFAIQGSGDTKAKKSLVRVIVAALVVNFSLFICYFLIDASNLLAHVFYNRITTEVSAIDNSIEGQDRELISVASFLFNNLGIEKSPSTAFVAAVNPQKLILSSTGVSGFFSGMLFITGLAIINGIMTWVFISVSLLFITRIIGLIILSFLSPLAFSSLAIPELKKQPYIGFDDWFDKLLATAFAAPIFTFFLWVTTKFTSAEGVLATIRTTDTSANFMIHIINSFLVLALVAGMLIMSKKITTDLAGKLSKQITGAVGKVIAGTATVAAVAATGGAAAAGLALRSGAAVTSATGGLAKGARGLGLTSTADRLQSMQNKLKNNKFGTTAANMGRALQSTKMDVTKVPGFSQLAGKEITGWAKKMPGVGVSARELERKTTLYMAKNNPIYRKDGEWKFDTGRKFKEAEFAYQQELEKTRKERGKWQETIEESKASKLLAQEQEKALENDTELTNAPKRDANGKAIIDPTTGKEVKATAKDLKAALEQAEKAVNDPTQQAAYQNDLNTKKEEVSTFEKSVKKIEEGISDTEGVVNTAQAAVNLATTALQNEKDALNTKQKTAETLLKEIEMAKNTGATKTASGKSIIQAETDYRKIDKEIKKHQTTITTQQTELTAKQKTLHDEKDKLTQEKNNLKKEKALLDDKKKSYEDTKNNNLEKRVENIKKDIQVNVYTKANSYVAQEYENKGNTKLADKIRKGQVKPQEKNSDSKDKK